MMLRVGGEDGEPVAADGSERQLSARVPLAVTRFQSAIVRSQAGMPEVSTKELDTMVTGKTSGSRLSGVASFFASSPRNTPVQVTAYWNRMSGANAARHQRC
jgi:hypothetical protein